MLYFLSKKWKVSQSSILDSIHSENPTSKIVINENILGNHEFDEVYYNFAFVMII